MTRLMRMAEQIVHCCPAGPDGFESFGIGGERVDEHNIVSWIKAGEGEKVDRDREHQCGRTRTVPRASLQQNINAKRSDLPGLIMAKRKNVPGLRR